MYLIPKNVKTRFEFKDGFGWKELGVMLAGGVAGVILLYLSGFVLDSFFARGLFLLAPIIGAFLLIQPHPLTKLSVLDTLRISRRFRRTRKVFYYQFGEGRKK